MTAAEILFGTEINSVNIPKLAQAVGVSPRTVRNWKRNPDMIPWGKMKVIARIRSLSGDDFSKMAKEK